MLRCCCQAVPRPADPPARALHPLFNPPPADQGHYRGVHPRSKLLSHFLGAAGAADLSPLASSAAAVAAAAAAVRAAQSPSLLSPIGTPPISSPTSEATGAPKLSSLLGGSGTAVHGCGGMADCAASAEAHSNGWAQHC